MPSFIVEQKKPKGKGITLKKALKGELRFLVKADKGPTPKTSAEILSNDEITEVDIDEVKSKKEVKRAEVNWFEQPVIVQKEPDIIYRVKVDLGAGHCSKVDIGVYLAKFRVTATEQANDYQEKDYLIELTVAKPSNPWPVLSTVFVLALVSVIIWLWPILPNYEGMNMSKGKVIESIKSKCQIPKTKINLFRCENIYENGGRIDAADKNKENLSAVHFIKVKPWPWSKEFKPVKSSSWSWGKTWEESWPWVHRWSQVEIGKQKPKPDLYFQENVEYEEGLEAKMFIFLEENNISNDSTDTPMNIPAEIQIDFDKIVGENQCITAPKIVKGTKLRKDYYKLCEGNTLSAGLYWLEKPNSEGDDVELQKEWFRQSSNSSDEATGPTDFDKDVGQNQCLKKGRNTSIGTQLKHNDYTWCQELKTGLYLNEPVRNKQTSWDNYLEELTEDLFYVGNGEKESGPSNFTEHIGINQCFTRNITQRGTRLNSDDYDFCSNLESGYYLLKPVKQGDKIISKDLVFIGVSEEGSVKGSSCYKRPFKRGEYINLESTGHVKFCG